MITDIDINKDKILNITLRSLSFVLIASIANTKLIIAIIIHIIPLIFLNVKY